MKNPSIYCKKVFLRIAQLHPVHFIGISNGSFILTIKLKLKGTKNTCSSFQRAIRKRKTKGKFNGRVTCSLSPPKYCNFSLNFPLFSFCNKLNGVLSMVRNVFCYFSGNRCRRWDSSILTVRRI